MVEEYEHEHKEHFEHEHASEHEHAHGEHHEHGEHHAREHESHEVSREHLDLVFGEREGGRGEKKENDEGFIAVAGAMVVAAIILIAVIWLTSSGIQSGIGEIKLLELRNADAISGVGGGAGFAPVDQATLGEKVRAYLNSNFLAAQGATAVVNNVSEKNGFYVVSFDITQNGSTVQSGEVFVSPDAQTLVIGSAFDLSTELPKASPQPSPSPQPAVKAAKPDVKLFVMSHCPYGVQAEYAMIPVIKLLGGNASFDIRFIATATGNRTFNSLHGPDEVQEDLRQVCIAANQKGKYLAYLECYVKAPAEAINSNNVAAYQAINWTSMAAQCIASAKVDAANVTACVNGEQGAALLTKNIALAEQLGVGSSPTMTINGGDYGGGRSSEAFKTGVCDAFTTAPAECSQQLSNATGTSSSVGCGT